MTIDPLDRNRDRVLFEHPGAERYIRGARSFQETTLWIIGITADHPCSSDRRVHLDIEGYGTVRMLPEYSANLRARLELAEHEVDVALDAVQPIRTSFHASTAVCECCGLTIAPGEDVAVFPEVERSVVMHWNPCPTTCSELIRRPVQRGGGEVGYVDGRCGRDAVDGRCERHQEVDHG